MGLKTETQKTWLILQESNQGSDEQIHWGAGAWSLGSYSRIWSRNLGVLPADTSPSTPTRLPRFCKPTPYGLYLIRYNFWKWVPNANLIPAGEKFQRLTSSFYVCKWMNLVDNLSAKWGFCEALRDPLGGKVLHYLYLLHNYLKSPSFVFSTSVYEFLSK